MRAGDPPARLRGRPHDVYAPGCRAPPSLATLPQLYGRARRRRAIAMRRAADADRPPHERAAAADLRARRGAALFERDPGRVERLFFEPRLTERCRRVLRGARPRPQALPRGRRGGACADRRHRAAWRHRRRRPAAAAARSSTRRRPRRGRADGKPLLILDGIGNPHNLGAIARTAAFFGIERIVLADRPDQALPSDASYRVAEGGLEHLTLYRAPLPAALAELRPALPHRRRRPRAGARRSRAAPRQAPRR